MEKLKDDFTKFTSEPKQRMMYEREALAFTAAEVISVLMEENKINKTELAQMFDTSKSNITNLLSGQRNMTTYSLADLAFVLGHKIEMRAIPMDAPSITAR